MVETGFAIGESALMNIFGMSFIEKVKFWQIVWMLSRKPRLFLISLDDC